MDVFLLAIIKTSIAMSVIILVFIIFNKLFSNKYPAKWRYYIGLAVVIGLLIPFKPSVSIPVPQVALPAQIIAQPVDVQVDTPLDALAAQNADNGEKVPQSAPITLGTKLFIIWLTVTFGILSYHFVRYRRFILTAWRWSADVEDEETLQVMRQALADLGLEKNSPMLRICKFVSSPMLTGFAKPVILLPSTQIPYDELRLILLHELTHYRRRDLWVKALVVVTNAMHWFNPFVLLLSATIQSDCEIACDEAVLAAVGNDERRLYGEAIIGVIGIKNRMQTAFSTYFWGGKSDMKKRLGSIMSTGIKSKTMGIFCAALIIAATVLSGSVFADARSAAAAPGDIGAEKAMQIATEKTGGGKVIKCELEYENRRKVYEVEIVNGNTEYELDIGAQNSKIYSFSSETIDNSNNPAPTTPAASDITAEKAKEIALKKAGGGTVVTCEVDYERGLKYYEIVITNGDVKYDIEVAAKDGAVRGYEEEVIKTPKPTPPAAEETAITADKAKQIALAKTGGGTVVKCELDYDDGVQVFDIEIHDGYIEYDIEVDATSGKIVEYDKDIDD